MFWLKKKLRHLFRSDDGTQLIEFAIVFPVLLLMFAGTAELGRMFYTYNSLAKATRGAARYLSTVPDVNANPCGSLQMSCTTAAKNMALCGNKAGCGGAGQPPVILPNFSASNIDVTPPVTTVGVKYVTIAITGYTYQPLVFNLNAMTGRTFNMTLAPSTRMRYMRN